jgi:Zn-dependent protease
MNQRTAVRPSPVFLGLLIVTAFGGWLALRGGSDTSVRVGVFILVGGGWIVSLCLHEFGHAYFAWRSGDHSTAERGYLTLNPLKYSNTALSFILPVLFVLLGGIGLPGGAVYVDRAAIPGRLRHSLISAAGPVANVVFALILAALIPAQPSVSTVSFWSGVAFLTFLQVTAALLNLVPFPGLDGYGIVEPYLPEMWRRRANQIAPYGLLIVIAILWIPAINSRFFSLITQVTDLLGVSPLLVGFGDQLFRFWTG